MSTTTTILAVVLYKAWVQKVLNRLLGCALITNGSESRRLPRPGEGVQIRVRARQVGHDRHCRTGRVDKGEPCNTRYVAWAQTALDKVGASMGAAVTGSMDSGTKAAIRTFQDYQKLLGDGWIGAKTETALIRESGIFPPGHIIAGVRPKPRKPTDTPRPIDPLPADKRMERVINAIIYEIKFNPTSTPISSSANASSG